MQVALAWLLQRSPNILLIPGTSSAEHLRENPKAASLQLPPETVAKLDAIGTKGVVAFEKAPADRALVDLESRMAGVSISKEGVPVLSYVASQNLTDVPWL